MTVAVQRIELAAEVTPVESPHVNGAYVRFADVEPALRDSTRLMWLLPIISGSDDALANRRTAALGAGLRLGLIGLSLVDYAMEGCPE